MVMEIKQSLFEAKYNEWELLSSKREWMLQNLKSVTSSYYLIYDESLKFNYLIMLFVLLQHFLLHNRDSCEKALTEYHFLHDSQDDYGPKEAENDVVGQLRVLNEVFSKTASVDTPTEVSTQDSNLYLFMLFLWTRNT